MRRLPSTQAYYGLRGFDRKSLVGLCCPVGLLDKCAWHCSPSALSPTPTINMIGSANHCWDTAIIIPWWEVGLCQRLALQLANAAVICSQEALPTSGSWPCRRLACSFCQPAFVQGTTARKRLAGTHESLATAFGGPPNIHEITSGSTLLKCSAANSLLTPVWKVLDSPIAFTRIGTMLTSISNRAAKNTNRPQSARNQTGLTESQH